MPFLIMMCGISGSGKSRLAQMIHDEIGVKVISSDEVRAEVLGDVNDQTKNGEVFEIVHKRVLDELNEGRACVYDATNLNRKQRIAFYKKVPKEIPIFVYLVATPVKACIERDAERERSVGKEVIYRQISRFELPIMEEGADIKIIHGLDFELEDLCEKLLGQTPHDCSPYHLETIETHCKLAYMLAKKDNCPDWFCKACLFHDIGKFYTKKWNVEKNRATYYNHQNWSAYLFLTSKEMEYFDNPDDAIMCAMIIALHMEPHFEGWERKKKKLSFGLRGFLEDFKKIDEASSIRKEN